MYVLFEVAWRLKTNEVLVLDLEKKNIGDAGARALAESLSHHRACVSLNLGSNPIGPSGAEEFAKALRTNKSLRYTQGSLSRV